MLSIRIHRPSCPTGLIVTALPPRHRKLHGPTATKDLSDGIAVRLREESAQVHETINAVNPFACSIGDLERLIAVAQTDFARGWLSGIASMRQRGGSGGATGTRTQGRAPSARELIELAERSLGGKEVARRWLSSPAVALGGAKPRDRMRAAYGRRDVLLLLGRIETGTYT